VSPLKTFLNCEVFKMYLSVISTDRYLYFPKQNFWIAAPWFNRDVNCGRKELCPTNKSDDLCFQRVIDNCFRMIFKLKSKDSVHEVRLSCQ